jgi:hypothetical protein
MPQEMLELDNIQVEFVNKYELYGFKNKSELIYTALEKLKQELEQRDLERSAELYAEIYAEDEDLQELTESALSCEIE